MAIRVGRGYLYPSVLAARKGASSACLIVYLGQSTGPFFSGNGSSPRATTVVRCDSRHPILVSSRPELLGPISQLILNACPDCDVYERRTRYRKSLKMWNSILSPLTPEARRSLARASRAWPSVLRRRFDSTLAHNTRKSCSYP